MAAAGANVVIADLNQPAEVGPRVRFVKTDVTEETSVKNAVGVAVKEFGRLHVSVQCAGIAVVEKLLGKNGPHSLATFSKVIAVNLVGTFNVVRLAAEAMAQRAERGR